MNKLKMGILATIAGGLLLGGSGLLLNPPIVSAAGSAASPTAQESAATVACQPSDGSWTDCTVTVTQSVPAGGSVAASLPAADGMVAFCDDGSPLSALCSLTGTGAAFACPTGCAAGTQFEESVLGAPSPVSANTLAREFVIAGPSAPSQYDSSTHSAP